MTNPQKLGPLKTTAGGKTSTFKTSTTNRALCCHGYLNCCNLDLFSCTAHVFHTEALGLVCALSVFHSEQQQSDKGLNKLWVLDSSICV